MKCEKDTEQMLHLHLHMCTSDRLYTYCLVFWSSGLAPSGQFTPHSALFLPGKQNKNRNTITMGRTVYCISSGLLLLLS